MLRLLVWFLIILVAVNLFRLLQVGRRIRQARREEEAPPVPPFDSIEETDFEDLGSSDEKQQPPAE